MFRIILAIVTAIVLLVGIVALVGSRLPVSHVASRAVLIDAPAESVFRVMTDFASGPAWRSGVQRVDVSTDAATARRRVVEVSKTGTMAMDVEAFVPPTRFVMRITGEGLPYGGAWAHALEPRGNATQVTITEHGEVYNPIFRFVSKYIMGHTGTIDAYLIDLGRKFGKTVTPVDAQPVPVQ